MARTQQFKCDRCAAEQTGEAFPTDWRVMNIWLDGGKTQPETTMDLCAFCAIDVIRKIAVPTTEAPAPAPERLHKPPRPREEHF